MIVLQYLVLLGSFLAAAGAGLCFGELTYRLTKPEGYTSTYLSLAIPTGVTVVIWGAVALAMTANA